MKELPQLEKRQYILEHGIKALASRDPGTWAWHLESRLWGIAADMPQGDTKIITTNAKGYADPYLMRVYLTPSQRDLLGYVWKAIAWRGRGWYPGEYERWVSRVSKVPHAYLHYFFRGDDDRAVHSHPWKRSASLILLNGYVEHRLDRETGKLVTRTLRPGNINYLRGDDFHKVTLLPGHGTWTLFISTERTHESDGTDWAFLDLDNNVRVPWGEWDEYSRRKQAFQGRPGMNGTNDPWPFTWSDPGMRVRVP